MPEVLDRVQMLLRDISVELDLEFPLDPTRIPFRDLAPHYARLAGLGVAERITAAHARLGKTEEASRFADDVVEALSRCADTWLGFDRTLVVIDVTHDLRPEAFAGWQWARLLFRADGASLPDWIQELVLRWRRWSIGLRMSESEWKRVLEEIHPRAFGALVEWGIDPVAGLQFDGAVRPRWVAADPLAVLDGDMGRFQKMGVDAMALRDMLLDAMAKSVPERANDTLAEQTYRVEDLEARAVLGSMLGEDTLFFGARIESSRAERALEEIA